MASPAPTPTPRGRESPLNGAPPGFRDRFAELFDAHFPRVFRVLDRLSGDPELAADLAQEVFVRLYRRGSMPASPEAWLISVAMNLFRNARSKTARRRRLLSVTRGRGGHGDPAPSPDRDLEARRTRQRVRAVLDGLPERDRALLLLRAEGYSYRDLAAALHLHEASVGTLLARARSSFRDAYEGVADAP